LRQPNLNALRMFEITGRALNFRLAAEEANLTQGAVAQQIRKLESDLEVQLFDRHARGLAFTQSGLSYYQSVSRGLALIDAATQELLSDDRSVTISMPPSFASKWLVPRLPEFENRHSDISIEAIASERLEDFRSTRVDFAIRQGSPQPQRGLTIHHLAPVRLVAACSPALAQEVGKVTQASDLLGQHLVEDAHGHWAAVAALAGVDDMHIRRFNQTALALDAAANGQGVVLAADVLTEHDVTDGRLMIVWRQTEASDNWFHAVHRRDRRLSDAAAKVLDWIGAEFG
jgi:LysR family glycine cleavage system transcriptional activator